MRVDLIDLIGVGLGLVCSRLVHIVYQPFSATSGKQPSLVGWFTISPFMRAGEQQESIQARLDGEGWFLLPARFGA